MCEKVNSDNHGLMKINQRPLFIVQAPNQVWSFGIKKTPPPPPPPVEPPPREWMSEGAMRKKKETKGPKILGTHDNRHV